jgi:hypothetical protein
MYKLFNFPSVNIITIPDVPERIETLLHQFEEYKVNSITVNVYEKYKPENHIFKGEYIDLLSVAHRATLSSHFKSIKKWYETTNEDYSFFCEDDLSLETVQYWKFDWCTFFNTLPKNWGCIQLSLMRDSGIQHWTSEHFGFKRRNWDDWSACAFIMKRSFVKKLLDVYYRDNIFTLTYRGIDEYARKVYSDSTFNWIKPVNETILFSLLEPVYTVPLFVENINFPTTNNLFLENQVHNPHGHLDSYNVVMNWWKNGGLDLNTVKNCSDVFI